MGQGYVRGLTERVCDLILVLHLVVRWVEPDDRGGGHGRYGQDLPAKLLFFFLIPFSSFSLLGPRLT